MLLKIASRCRRLRRCGSLSLKGAGEGEGTRERTRYARHPASRKRLCDVSASLAPLSLPLPIDQKRVQCGQCGGAVDRILGAENRASHEEKEWAGKRDWGMEWHLSSLPDQPHHIGCPLAGRHISFRHAGYQGLLFKITGNVPPWRCEAASEGGQERERERERANEGGLNERSTEPLGPWPRSGQLSV